MGKVIISTAMTVDGVADGFEWYVSEGGHDGASREQFQENGAMLLGRKTYEGLAGYWPAQEGPWADLLNPVPKFVVSRTLKGPLEWNATLLEGEIEESVPKLRDSLKGDLVVSGCGEFARDLIAKGLVDELRFWLHPVVWGTGVRPYEGETVRMRLVEAKGFDSGVTLLRFKPLRG